MINDQCSNFFDLSSDKLRYPWFYNEYKKNKFTIIKNIDIFSTIKINGFFELKLLIKKRILYELYVYKIQKIFQKRFIVFIFGQRFYFGINLKVL